MVRHIQRNGAQIDEAHRFANTFHRERRGKAALRSSLDDIVGIGKTRRQALLRHFGTVAAIAAASLDELARASGMNKKAAQAVVDHFAAPADATPAPASASPDPDSSPPPEPLPA